MIGFVNTRTGARTQELKGFQTETEAETVARLKAAGWEIEKGKYEYDEQQRVLRYTDDGTKAKQEEDQKEEADPDGASSE